MATSPYESPSTAGSTSPDRAAATGLRLWPAVLLLVAIFVMPRVPAMLDGPGLPVMMFSFMSPALFGVLIVVWWALASRATARERRLGTVAILVLGAIGLALLHPSLGAFGAVMHVVPSAMAAFGIAVVVLAGSPRFRLPAALLALAAALGYWDLLRSDGVTGAFQPELSWRWTPIAEEEFLRSLATSSSSSSSASSAAPAPDTSSSTPQSSEASSSNASSGEASSASSSTRVEAKPAVEPVDLASASWPAFRGPLRDGKRPGVRLAEDWQAGPPREVWRTRVGPGWSSFSIAGNRLWTQEQRGPNEAVVCLRADTGETIWAHEYPGRFTESISGAGPRATPTLTPAGVFALGAQGDLMRLDPDTGNVIWKADLKQDAQRTPPTWGFSASPLVTDGKVIVHAGGGGDRGVLAYEAESGKLLWSVASGDHSYSSAQLATFDGVTGALMVTNRGLQFLDVTDGHEIWNYDWPVENYRVLQPTVIGSTVLLSATLGDGTRSVSVAHQGSDWQVTENWKSREMKPEFNDLVEHRGFLYGFDGNIMTCVDLATGKRRWKKGRYGNGQLVLLPDADQLLVTSETGELVLVRATSERWEEVGRIAALEGKTWNHPVVDGNRVYLRNGQEVACFELSTQ
ncbi:MAG: PQQ-binding-like beta-propeller repeat protein [Pirellulales bacterium]